MTPRRLIAGLVAAAMLVAGVALAANVTKRYRGTHSFDRVNGQIVSIAGTDITSTAAELNYVDVTAGTAAGSKALVLSSGGTIAGITRVSAGNYRTASTTISASADLSTATLDAYQLWYVTTTGGAVDLDFGEDAALNAADVGQTWRFLIVAGTNALTITAGTSVSTVGTSVVLGTACEDVGDYFDCVPYTTTAVQCWAHCADN